MNDKYILDPSGNPVRVYNLHEWAQWFETADRKVAYFERDDVRVSTVFLGIDHRYSPNEPRQLFETMIFGGEHNDFQERYATRAEALAGHERAVAMVGGAQ